MDVMVSVEELQQLKEKAAKYDALIEKETTETKKLILGTVSDLVKDFMKYDRKNDEELNQDRLHGAIESGLVTIDEITEAFRDELLDWVK